MIVIRSIQRAQTSTKVANYHHIIYWPPYIDLGRDLHKIKCPQIQTEGRYYDDHSITAIFVINIHNLSSNLEHMQITLSHTPFLTHPHTHRRRCSHNLIRHFAWQSYCTIIFQAKRFHTLHWKEHSHNYMKQLQALGNLKFNVLGLYIYS